MVDLVHLQNDVVRHASFSQQHIQLPRHAPCNGVDTEPAEQTKIHIPTGTKRTLGKSSIRVFDLAWCTRAEGHVT